VTTPTYDIVVSAENTDGHAWQSMLFHWSCRTHTGRTPIFVVHGNEPELAPGFAMIVDDGGRIQRRPNFRHRGAIMYAPRNQMRTTQLVESDATHVVVCDPDMIFLGPVDFYPVIDAMAPDQISMDRIAFLTVTAENRPYLEPLCAAIGVDIAALEREPMNGAPPHVVAQEVRGPLCRQWQVQLERYLDASYAHYGGYDENVWISSMWGLVLALHAAGMRAHLTDLCVHTHGNPPITEADRSRILHYSYETDDFDKRTWARGQGWREVWASTAAPGTASGEICAQLSAAAAHYGL
jgi:hypothetical protein